MERRGSRGPAASRRAAIRIIVLLASLAIAYVGFSRLTRRNSSSLKLKQHSADDLLVTLDNKVDGTALSQEQLLAEHKTDQVQLQHQEDLAAKQDSASLPVDAKVANANLDVKEEAVPQGDKCHTEEHAEYDGDAVAWVFSEASAERCCEACRGNNNCNVWSWCAREEGCGDGHQKSVCWLKHQTVVNLAEPPGRRGPDVGWTSGAIYEASKREEAEEAIRKQNEAERQRLLALKNNETLPLVYMDISIKDKPVGRMEFVLFPDESPRAAENFRCLFTGEKGVVPQGREGEGRPYHFKGTHFYRIIDRFIDQGGAETESVYGGDFKDDPGGLKLKHDRKGLLSIANAGPNTNDSHFSIMMGPAPFNDGNYVVFGELVAGWDVALAINALSKGTKGGQAGRDAGALITDSGQLRRGAPIVVPTN